MEVILWHSIKLIHREEEKLPTFAFKNDYEMKSFNYEFINYEKHFDCSS